MRTGIATRDRHLRSAMDADRFPVLRFELTAVEQGASRGDTVSAVLVGRLTIHGTEREIRVPAEVLPGRDSIAVRAGFPIDMRDYGVKPPVRMLGALRVAREPGATLVARRLASVGMVLCASPAYLKRHGTPRTPEELAQHQTLSFSYLWAGDDWTFEDAHGHLTTVRVNAEVHATNGDVLRELASTTGDLFTGFEPAELDWLSGLGLFRPAFLDYLAGLRFSGEVQAMAEGTPFFADEPILRVVAPLPEAQLVESRLINLLHFQTLIASKAARVAQLPPSDFHAMFADEVAFRESTAAARANGYVAGDGSRMQLEREIGKVLRHAAVHIAESA